MKTIAALIAPMLLTGASAAGMAQPTDHQQHHAAEQPSQPQSQRSAMLRTPDSIAAEHHELHETLARASKEAGELGRAAGELERALAPHFKREEEIATPPLGRLPALARGDATREMRAVLPMPETLERELPQMLREHDVIREAVGKFRAAAAALVGRYVDRPAPKEQQSGGSAHREIKTGSRVTARNPAAPGQRGKDWDL